jgi:oligopeptide transport system ATP-binding protein
MALLEIEGLNVWLPVGGRRTPVLVDVNLSIDAGQVLGIAGESGSGKTMTGLAVLRLLPDGAVCEGSIRLDGRELLTLGDREIRQVRGGEVAMVFQDPTSSLHPMLPVGRQLTDHLRRHRGLSRKAASARAAELLGKVRLPDPERTLRAYPHQLSGGMRQRVAIAVALACEPKLIIADEPTTALDVTVQAGILELLDALRAETGVGIVMITHNLGVLSSVADELAVFYAGRIIERSASRRIFGGPQHPYTRALLAALPHPDAGPADRGLRPMPGAPPALGEWPRGCAFAPRCPERHAPCDEHVPPLLDTEAGHEVACFARRPASDRVESVS